MNAQTQPPTKTKPGKSDPKADGAASKAALKEGAAANGADATAPPKESKPRGPRKDYGYAAGSTIKLAEGEKNYRGQRLEWYNHLKAANGKTVEAFVEATKSMKDPARGWIRFFVQDEACTLIPPPKAPDAPAAAQEAKPAA